MEVILRVEEREYIKPEKVSEEVINAINIVKEYCKSHEEFEDCRHCVLGDGIHNCGCSSPWLWNIRKQKFRSMAQRGDFYKIRSKENSKA